MNHHSVQLISQSLDALSVHTAINPDHLLTLNAFPRIVLERPSVSGGVFWLGTAMETGVSVRWGSTGRQGTVKHIAKSRCKNGDPVQELKIRTLRKLYGGYDIMPQETVLP